MTAADAKNDPVEGRGEAERTIPDSETVYREYHSRVLGYFRSHLHNAVEAEDLAAEVFVRVLKALPDYDPQKASISTWIYAISHNVLIDHFRRNRETAELPEELSAPGDILEDIVEEEELESLADALLKLSPEERQVIVLRYYAGKPLTEVAFRMGLSYGAVKIRHNKALAQLKRLLK